MTDTPAAPPTERQPTQEDIMAMAAAAQDAVKSAQTAEAALKAATEAMQATATERGLTIPEETLKEISEGTAAATVGMLRELGALRSEDDPPEPPAADPPKDPPGDGDPPPGDGEPGRKTFAERYLGL